MRCLDLVAVVAFLAISSFGMTTLLFSLPSVFSLWYTVFVLCALVVWLFLDNYTLALDLKKALDSESHLSVVVCDLEQKNRMLDNTITVNDSHFKKVLQKQISDAEDRLSYTLNQICIVRN